MTKTYSIAEARDRFTTVVHEVEGGVKVELTRRGKPVAIVLAVEEYERLSRGRQSFREAYRRFRQEFDLHELAIDPDEVFGELRDRSPGRGFTW